jgi:alpha-L-arabinofuranosidase
VYVTPIHLVNQLYREHQSAERLVAVLTGPTFDSSREGTGIPYLDAVASRSADGREVLLKVVNTDREHPQRLAVELKGFQPAARGRLASIVATAPGATVGFATPDAIAIRRSEIDAGRTFAVDLPAASVSVLRLSSSRGTGSP